MRAVLKELDEPLPALLGSGSPVWVSNMGERFELAVTVDANGFMPVMKPRRELDLDRP